MSKIGQVLQKEFKSLKDLGDMLKSLMGGPMGGSHSKEDMYSGMIMDLMSAVGAEFKDTNVNDVNIANVAGWVENYMKNKNLPEELFNKVKDLFKNAKNMKDVEDMLKQMVGSSSGG
jgi:hypothetical protein